MGAVFIAEHVALQKQVALKTIHAELTGHAEIAARFAREAMASARIEHPGVVSALDFGTLEGGGAFLVMQLVRGEGLRERLLRESALPWCDACELMEQMSDAVAAAHAEGIVHRDLKPENVVLENAKSGGVVVRVLDFGIAHLRSESALAVPTHAGAPLTRLGVVMGTPGYMAPEQAVGQPVDERTDVYALGVMLWELLAGRRPFSGETLTAIITQQFAAEPPALPSDAQAVPSGLAALVAQMLSARPEERPASAFEVRDRLRALRHEPQALLPALAGKPLAVPQALGALKARAVALFSPQRQAAAVRTLGVLKARAVALTLRQKGIALGALILSGIALWLQLREPALETAKVPPVAAQSREIAEKTQKRSQRASREERAEPVPTSTPTSAQPTPKKPANESGGQSGGSSKQGGRRVGDKLKRAVNSIFN